jgi:hypothetical protein
MDRDTFQWGLDYTSIQEIVAIQSQRLVDADIMPRSLTPQFGIFDLDLIDERERRENLVRYYSLCLGSKGILVTIACFAPWGKAKKTNSYGKVIPAVRTASKEYRDPVRVFFFDDNIEWDGKADSSGICNLRDVETGAFVDFGEGANGFVAEHAATNTVVHHSTEYRTVLVQADILDAMEFEDYFTGIINKYTKPGEKVIAYVDVNSTVISVDTRTGKDMSYILLNTLLERIKIRPRGSGFNFDWDGFPSLKVDKPTSIKALAKKMFIENKEFYDAFYTMDNTKKLLESLAAVADLAWSQKGKPAWTLETFMKEYNHYLVALVGGTDDEGITKSWYKLVKALQDDHCIMVNSFGVDTRKLLLKTVQDERQVLQLAIGFKHWDPKDISAFEKVHGVRLKEADILSGLSQEFLKCRINSSWVLGTDTKLIRKPTM